MTHGEDSEVDRHRVDAFASEDELTLEEFLQATPTAPARPTERRRSASSLYQRIGCAGGLLWLVNTLYLRVLAVVTGGPSKYQGRDLHEAHAELHITEEAFDRVVWHLQATLQELEVQQQDQQAILAAVQARRDAVVTFEKSS